MTDCKVAPYRYKDQILTTVSVMLVVSDLDVQDDDGIDYYVGIDGI